MLFKLVNFVSMATGDAAGAAEGGGNSILTLISSLWPMLLLVVLFYFMLIRPQKKKDKEKKEMMGAMQVGDSITTNAGIVGKIINIKDDEVTIETGIEKTKILLKKWAITEVNKLIDS